MDEAAAQEGLLAWLAGEGAQLAGLALAPSRALRCLGLHAAAPLAPGAALARLPLRLVLTARRGLLRDAQACAAFLALRQPSPALALLLCLAHARSGAPSAAASPWRAYALSLPAAVPSLLHGRARARALRRALAARGLAHLAPRALAERRALREGCAAAAARAAPAHAAWATPAALRWAHAAYASRAMRLPSGEAAMVPLLDMANHCAASPLSFAYAPAAGAPAAAEPPPASAQALAALALLGASEAASAGATTLPSCVFQALLQAPAAADAAAAAAAPAPAPAPAAALPFPARSAQQQSLALVLGRAPAAAGQELLINYGTAKSSFSFALLSGFVPRQPNRGDTCAVHFERRSGALALGEGGGGAGAQGFVLTWAGLPSGVLAAARSVCGCSGGSGSSAAPAPPRNALACDPELAAFMAEHGAQGAAVVQWLAGQCLQLSSALEAARRAPAAQLQAAEGGERGEEEEEEEEEGGEAEAAEAGAAAALALAGALSEATSALLQETARELLSY